MRANVTGAAAISSVTGPVVELAGDAESVALMEKLEFPAVVGVPVSEQPVKVSPLGIVPLASAQE